MAASTLFSVAGKNVLVTGGSRGIGLMIAKGFSEQGANVLLTSRSEDACREAAKQLQEQLNSASSANNSVVHYTVSNLSTRQGCEDLAQHVATVFDNKLHVLINNAGTSWGEPMSRESSPQSNWGFDKVFDLNVKSLFYLTRSCMNMLQAAATPEDPARVINVGSVAGMIGQAAPTHAYDASKAAVHAMTRKWAAEFAALNITVNCLAPGYVPSRMTAGLKTWGADQEFINDMVPLGRMGNGDDMAGACIYLSSRAGSYVSGVILNVDGGAVAGQQIPISPTSKL